MARSAGDHAFRLIAATTASICRGFGVDPGGGDVITAVDGEEVTSASDLPRIISLLDLAQTVTLEFVRTEETEEIALRLADREVATVPE